ncbi:MAG: Uma2 family endonuclease [Egibacteraceae bacterium]
MEIRFTRQLTRIPDLLVIRGEDPCRHWFSPAEVTVASEIESPGSHVEDRTTKPALYSRFGIPHYCRVQWSPLQIAVYRLGEDDTYSMAAPNERLKVDVPFPIDLALADLLILHSTAKYSSRTRAPPGLPDFHPFGVAALGRAERADPERRAEPPDLLTSADGAV